MTYYLNFIYNNTETDEICEVSLEVNDRPKICIYACMFSQTNVITTDQIALASPDTKYVVLQTSILKSLLKIKMLVPINNVLPSYISHCLFNSRFCYLIISERKKRTIFIKAIFVRQQKIKNIKYPTHSKIKSELPENPILHHFLNFLSNLHGQIFFDVLSKQPLSPVNDFHNLLHENIHES